MSRTEFQTLNSVPHLLGAGESFRCCIQIQQDGVLVAEFRSSLFRSVLASHSSMLTGRLGTSGDKTQYQSAITLSCYYPTNLAISLSCPLLSHIKITDLHVFKLCIAHGMLFGTIISSYLIRDVLHDIHWE